MLIFKNKASGNGFLVDNEAGTVTNLLGSEWGALAKFQKFFGGLEYLELPNLKTINQFRKLIAKGILKDVPLVDTRQFLLNSYPEYFI